MTDPARAIEHDWKSNPRWHGVTRPYGAADVVRLRGSIVIEYTLARIGAEKLWRYLHEKPFVNALGALTGNQAMQQVRAGLDGIYLSGWQVAGDANLAGHMYPDQSLYPADSVPAIVRRINNTLQRADQIDHAEGRHGTDWFKPIVADAEAGFGGVLNAFELMKAMIEAGAAGVHFEDQLSSAKKCGHMGGKVLVPTQEAINKLVAARLAADICAVPTVLVARTDAESASLLTARSANVRRRVSSTSSRARSPRSRAASLTHPTRIWCGARPPCRTSRKRKPSPRACIVAILASFSPITARHHSTGSRGSTTRP
jgi:isocitrate lyase